MLQNIPENFDSKFRVTLLKFMSTFAQKQVNVQKLLQINYSNFSINFFIDSSIFTQYLGLPRLHYLLSRFNHVLFVV